MRARAIAPSLLGTTILFVSWITAGAQEPVEKIRGGTSAAESPKIPKFDSAPGWEWAMFPQKLRIGRSFGQASSSGIILSGYSVVDADGVLRLSFVQVGPSIDDTLRLVVLDAAGKRDLPKWEDAGGMDSLGTRLNHVIYSLDPKMLPPGKPAYIAAERRTPKAR